MAGAKHTFKLPLPDNRTVDVVVIELEDGTIVARTQAELDKPTLPLRPADRG